MPRPLSVLLAVVAAFLVAPPLRAEPFREKVVPFLTTYCVGCHKPEKKGGELDLTRFDTAAKLLDDFRQWEHVLTFLKKEEMPPATAKQPSAELRAEMVATIETVLLAEAKKLAGDPGVVPPRRLTNAEYDNTVSDLIGYPIQPAKTFPVDPASGEGFSNTGEALTLSPALFKKYYAAAEFVADHALLTTEGVRFAPHPAVAFADRQKFYEQAILQFYAAHAVDYEKYFLALWQYKHRPADKQTVGEWAAARKLSAKYAATLWEALEGKSDDKSSLAQVREKWAALPDAEGPAKDGIRSLAATVKKMATELGEKETPAINPGAGNGPVGHLAGRRKMAAARGTAASAADAAFCRVFPNRFYFVDDTRGLSAGFHLIEGFFRDDQPLCRLVLTDAENAELNRLWRELYFVTGIWEKMLRGFVFFERSERNFLKHRDFDAFKEEDPELTNDDTLARFQAVYLKRSNVTLTGDELAKHPISIFFADIRNGLKADAATRKAVEATCRNDLLAFAERAYRRPLTAAEREKLELLFGTVWHDPAHGPEAAVRATITRVLVSPHFVLRFDPTPAGKTVAPLSDVALASRLSYFLWAGPPDAELLALAKAGKLHDDATLREQVRRMVRDPKVSRFALEFFGQWLGYRAFLTDEAVNRQAFPAFDDALKQAMFEEPTRLATHLIQQDKPITDLLDGDTTFVNRRLARHYGLPFTGTADEWRPATGLRAQGRGGVLGMAVFLTKNSQPQRTSPVKRGFWVVHTLLGEHIPPPPPDVAVLPAKETEADKTTRELLKLHVAEAACARCHQRFDPVGLAMEGFDPIGRVRAKDLAGRPVDNVVQLQSGKQARGVPEFAAYLAADRRGEFTKTLGQKFLGYALGRSLQLSDQPLLDRMQAELTQNGHKLSALFELVALSPQFRTQRCQDFTPANFSSTTGAAK